MQIIIIGCGKVGSRIAYVLSREGHDVVIIDRNRNAFEALDSNFNGITVTGVPIDQDVLKEAGIENADVLISVTPDDNVNIMVCQVAKEIFQVKRVLARIYNPLRENVFHEFGLNTFCPTNITVEKMRDMIFGDDGITYHNLGQFRIKFKSEKVPRKFEGKRVKDIKFSNENLFLFGIIRDNGFQFSKPNIYLNKDDIMIIAER